MYFNLIDKAKITIDGITTIRDLSVKQNTTYSMLLRYTGDVRSLVLKGEIRNKSFDLGGLVLGNFIFSDYIYDSQTNKTLFLATIPVLTTRELQPTEYQGKGELNQDTAYVYDIKLIDQNTDVVINLIDLSYIQVKPTVTDVLSSL